MTLVLSGALAACGPFFPGPKEVVKPDAGSTRDGGSDAGASVSDAGLPVAMACPVMNSTRCELLTRCGLVGADAPSQADCLQYYEATWCGPTRWSPRVDPRINTLKYDPVIAQQCVDALANRSCSMAMVLPDACSRFLKPNALDKQDCYGGYNECVEGTCRGAVCPRTCRARGQMGESCDIDDDCRSSLYCRSSMTSPTVSTCATPAAVGEMCIGARCADGLFCNRLGICVTLPGPQQACVQGQCDPTASCSGDAGVCIERKADGLACVRDDDCRLDSLCLGLNSVGTCAPIQLMAGAVCYPRQVCASGTVCMGVTESSPGVCKVPLTEGAVCTTSIECEPHLTCTSGPEGLRCTPRFSVGEQCRNDGDCHTFATCVEGACLPKPTLGERCNVGIGCLTGACQLTYTPADAGELDGGVNALDAGSTRETGVCVDLLSAGASCRSGTDCASGRCEFGYCTAACSP